MGNPHARKVSPERSRTAAQTETPFCKFSLRLQAKPQAKRWMRICEEVHSLGGLPTQALAKTHRLVMDSYPPKSWPQLIPSPKSPKPGPGERRLRRKPSLTLAPSAWNQPPAPPSSHQGRGRAVPTSPRSPLPKQISCVSLFSFLAPPHRWPLCIYTQRLPSSSSSEEGPQSATFCGFAPHPLQCPLSTAAYVCSSADANMNKTQSHPSRRAGPHPHRKPGQKTRKQATLGASWEHRG